MRVSNKKHANLSVRGELLADARKAGINLSALLERAITQELSQSRREQWIEKNRAAMDRYNDLIAEHGLLSDHWRGF